jgi:hypothetical protein
MSTGFSRCGMVFFIFTIRSAFFRSLFCAVLKGRGFCKSTFAPESS